MRPFRILLSLLLALFTYACKDLHELDCFFWSNLGECEANPFVALRCQASCGSCTADGNATRGPDVVVIDASGAEQLLPFPEAFDDPIVSIESGELHLVMLLASGTVVTFGDDSSGQLGTKGRAAHTNHAAITWSRLVAGAAYSKSGRIRAGRLYSGALLTTARWSSGDRTRMVNAASLRKRRRWMRAFGALRAAGMPRSGSSCTCT